MKAFKNFLLYNNTIPLLFGVLFLGAGATFAASPEARQTVVDSRVAVTEVDNSYLLNTTITEATVGITIGSVTEDVESYYIEYQMSTMEARDGAWQPTIRTKTLVVDKESVISRDLGLYAEEEIAEVHAAEIRLLKETQASERRNGITPKVVTTEYSGLVGQFFDPNQEVFPQYSPLIDPSVGIPLTREQEKAHEAVKRLIDEEKAKQEPEQRDRENQPEEPNQTPDEENPEPPQPPPEEPIEVTPPVEPIPAPEPEPEPTPEPVLSPEPTPEPPQTLESIGL